MVSPSFIDSSAAALAEAWSTGTITDPPFVARAPDRDEAYAIQDRMVELLAPRLGPRVGWKLGMTAPGLSAEPIVGPVHRTMLIPPGASLTTRPQLLIEVEIALHIRPQATPGISRPRTWKWALPSSCSDAGLRHGRPATASPTSSRCPT